MSIDKKQEVRQAPEWPTRRHNPRERKVLQTSMEYVPTVPTDWPGPVPPSSLDEALDALAHSQAGQALRCTRVVWDLSQHGGQVGTHAVLTLSAPLPAGSVIQAITMVVQTALTSPTSSGSLTLVGLTGAPTALAGSGTLAATSQPSAPQVLTSAMSTISVAVSGEDLLTGRATFYVTSLT
jgi:hypothetical protein